MLLSRLFFLVTGLALAHALGELLTPTEEYQFFFFPTCDNPKPRREDALDLLHDALRYGASIVAANNGTTISIREIKHTTKLISANVKRSHKIIDDNGRPVLKLYKCRKSMEYLLSHIDKALDQYFDALMVVVDRIDISEQVLINSFVEIKGHLDELIQAVGTRCPTFSSEGQNQGPQGVSVEANLTDGPVQTGKKSTKKSTNTEIVMTEAYTTGVTMTDAGITQAAITQAPISESGMTDSSVTTDSPSTGTS